MKGVRALNEHQPFKVFATKHIDIDHRNIISLLYAPLIGADSVTLYFALYALIDRSQLRTPAYPVSFLLDLLDVSERRLLDARKRLEATGLLETHRSDDDFVFELIAPMSAERFIKDSPLAPYLLRHLGEKRFNEVIDLFKIRRVNLGAYENISVAFSDMFEPVQVKVHSRASHLEGKVSRLRIDTKFNTDVLFDMLPEHLIHSEMKTTRAKERFRELAYLYDLEETDMKDAIVKSFDTNGRMDFETLSKQCRTLYQASPKRAHHKSSYSGDVHYMKNTHPKKLLEDLTGSHIPSADMKVLERLLGETDLSNEVLNVLIAFVVKELDGRVPHFNYFDKIIAQWKRLDIDTAEKAMDHVKKQKHQKSAPKHATKRSRRYIPKDVEIDWLDDYIQSLEEDES